MAITPCQKVTTLEYVILAGVAMIVICALFGVSDIRATFLEKEEPSSKDAEIFL